jgi:DNA invertase Pin-like site-specific DNA recombinase
MTTESKALIRCAIYTRKSSEEGLEQSFNSLDAQREACEAFIASSTTRGLASTSGLLRRWRILGWEYESASVEESAQ